MEQTKDTEASMEELSKHEERKHQKKTDEKSFLEKAHRVFAWLLSIACSVFPLLGCVGLKMLYPQNQAKLDKYTAFISDFFSSGSFLWIAITLLATSLIDVLLHGFKENISDKAKLFYKVFLVISIVFIILGIAIFFVNIGDPIDESLMRTFSIITSVLFAISSGIISFKFMQEV